MSARTAQLVEDITALEQKLTQETEGSASFVALREQLLSLYKQLSSAAVALHEGKQVLKG